jgi:hypothetical protein
MTAPVLDINDVIAEAAAAALPDTVDETAVATDLEEIPQDDAASDEDVSVSPAENTEEDASSDDAVLPEGYVAVPTLSEGLATEFALYDEDGEVEVPSLMVEYKANGKVRKDRLDQVVKLAQWGVYNEERDRKAQAVEQEYQQSLSALQQMEAAIVERESQMERLLHDDEFLEAVREAYLNENSPEKRVQRAEQETQNLRVQHQMQDITRNGEQFYEQEIMPAVQMITDALPNISVEDIESRLTMVMQAHAEIGPNGQPYVPPSRYDAIRQYIVEDLAVWAQMVNVKRSKPDPSATQRAALQSELDKARIEAQKAKNLLGKATKPTGTVGKMNAPKSAPLSTVDDAVDSALRSALASFSS